jgi:RecA-family ATPase
MDPIADKHAEPRFRLLSPAELAALPKPNWLIEGVLPEHSFCVLYGEPGSGKTFVALSMALSVAADHSWCGKPAVGGAVLYVAAEGLYGLPLRVEAYQTKHGLSAQNIRYLGEAFDLRNPDDIEELLVSLQAEGIQPVLIVLDTLARLMVGADENSAKDMGLAIAGIDWLRQKTRAAALVVHHTRKNGQTERGSSALRGAADVMIECKKPDQSDVHFECAKMKDAEPFKKAALGLEKVPLGEKSSLAITSWQDAEDDDNDVPADPAHVDAALNVLEKQFGPVGATHKEWKREFHAATGKSPSTFARVLKNIKSDPRVRVDGKRYFAVRKADGVTVKSVSSGIMTVPG